MTAVPDDSLLDDLPRLGEADPEGLLRAGAMAGAQVRATAEASLEAGIDRLGGLRPRAVVLMTRPGLGPAVSRLLAELLLPACPVPLVITDVVPPWVGALDVVIAHTDDPGDVQLAEDVDRAGRRGAGVVLTGPAEGPVAAAAAGNGVLITPRLPIRPGFGFPTAFTSGLLALKTLDLLRFDANALADELDREAERDHPQHESFVNPAKTLALRLAEHAPLLWGLDHVATAVGRHAVQVLGTHTDLVCDVVGFPQANSRSALFRSAVRATSERDIFADPDNFDGPAALPPRVVLLAVRARPGDPVRRQAHETLPAADVIDPAEEISADEPTRAAVLALRFELAALYLGLAAGTTGGSGRYAPATA
ncbi:SIS domain-containing protein [Actinokineospora diospyrosa]|uniref:Phospho-glucose isomerase C-terminal SIS domain-containing protein n=1 Tax=Actinokineospora diospyrosa TaxID=103728 RepID=A0ABT1IIA2_9PSEU|nr:SIS domain-containing protein [Actinokineospora diospyrosa]MCP2272284.1 phospho-glucose isomerase C-terminal SIS domain-containing protein [Actinokineospora diospyrosa]